MGIENGSGPGVSVPNCFLEFLDGVREDWKGEKIRIVISGGKGEVILELVDGEIHEIHGENYGSEGGKRDEANSSQNS